jgi:hypothetical protein
MVVRDIPEHGHWQDELGVPACTEATERSPMDGGGDECARGFPLSANLSYNQCCQLDAARGSMMWRGDQYLDLHSDEGATR